MSKSRKNRHHHDEHEEGHSEGWLVSYADMMTLLFGLFVMLYSIAMENQGQIDNQLRDVSSSLSKTASPPPPPPAPKPPEVTVEQQEEIIKKKDEELAQIKKAMETIEQERKEIDLQFTSYKIKNTELTEQVEILKKELKPVEPKLPVMPDLRLVQAEDKNKKLVEELEVAKKLKKETETEIEKIKFEKQQLEKKIAEAKVVTKREVAAVDDKVQKINELDKLVQQEKKQKDELQKQVQQDRTIAAELQKELQQKEKQMEQINKDLKALQDEEKKAPKFLMFVLKWFTERHDLDLIVYDSKGKKFDFKKRDYPNYPGRLALDSRSGPGAEIWQTNEFIPGDYRMIVQFYQEYNNSEDAKFVIEVSSPKTSFATSSNSIKFSEKQKEFKFRVSEKGAVTLL